MEENIKELLRKLYISVGKTPDEGRISSVLSANANNPYAAIEFIGQETGAAAALEEEWDPYQLMDIYGVEYGEESTAPIEPLEEVEAVAEMPVEKPKVPDIIKKYSDRGIRTYEELEKAKPESRPELSDYSGSGFEESDRVGFADPADFSEVKEDSQNIMSEDLEFVRADEVLNEVLNEEEDYVAAYSKAANRINLIRDVRNRQINSLATELTSEYGEEATTVFTKVANAIKKGEWDKVDPEYQAAYTQYYNDPRFNQWYTNMKREQAQATDFTQSRVGRYAKEAADERLRSQMEVDSAYKSDVAKGLPTTNPIVVAIRAKAPALLDFAYSIGDMFGASKVEDLDDLDDDLRAQYEQATSEAERREILLDQAARVKRERDKRENSQMMPSNLEGMPVEKYIERDGRKYVIEDGRITNIRDEKGFSVIPMPFSKEAMVLAEYEASPEDFEDEITTGFSVMRTLSQGTGVMVEMAPMIVAAMGTGGVAAGLGAGARGVAIAAQAGSGMGSFFHTYHDNYWRGVEMFGDSDQASKYAAVQSGLTAAIESFIGNVEGKFGRALLGTERRAIQKAQEAAARQAMAGSSTKDVMQSFYGSIVGELGEEIADVFKESIVDASFKGVEWESPSGQEILNTAILTVFATSGIAGASVSSQVKNDMLADFRMAMENQDQFVQVVDQMADIMIENGRDEATVRANAEGIKRVVRSVAKEMSDIDANFELDEKTRDKVEKLLIDRAEAEVRLSNTTNEAARKKIDAEVAAHDSAIEKLLNDSKDTEGVRGEEQGGQESGGTVQEQEGGAETTPPSGTLQTEEEQQADQAEVVAPSQGSTQQRTNSKGVTQEYTYDEQKQAWTLNGRKAGAAIQEDLNRLFEEQQAPTSTEQVTGQAAGQVQGQTAETEGVTEGTTEQATEEEPISRRQRELDELSVETLSGTEYTTKAGTRKRVTFVDGNQVEVTTVKKNGELGSTSKMAADKLLDNLKDPDNDSFTYDSRIVTEATAELELNMDTDAALSASDRISSTVEQESLDVNTVEGAARAFDAGTPTSPTQPQLGESQPRGKRDTKTRGRDMNTALSVTRARNNAKTDSAKRLFNIAAKIRPTMKRLGVKMVSHKNAESLANALIEAGMDEQEALNMAYNSNGLYNADTKTMHVREDSSVQSALHEAMHPMFAEMMRATPKALTNFLDYIINDSTFVSKYFAEFAAKYADRGFEEQVNEAAVEFFADELYGRMVEDVANTTDPTFLQKVRDLISAVLKDLGFNTAQTRIISKDVFPDQESIASFLDNLADAFRSGDVVALEQERFGYEYRGPQRGGIMQSRKQLPDSKIVNEDGTLKTVYRSQRDDRRQGVERQSNTYGIYFSENKESTKIYGENTREYNLNITNPLVLEGKDWNLSIIPEYLFRDLVSKGYDGAIWMRNGEMYEIVAFNESQVIPISPNIMQSRKAPISSPEDIAKKNLQTKIALYYANAATADTPLDVFYQIPEIKAALESGMLTKESIRSLKGQARRLYGQALRATKPEVTNILNVAEAAVTNKEAAEVNAKIDEVMLAAPDISKELRDYITGLHENAASLTDDMAVSMAEAVRQYARQEIARMEVDEDGERKELSADAKVMILARTANAVFRSIFENMGKNPYDMLLGWQLLGMQYLADEIASLEGEQQSEIHRNLTSQIREMYRVSGRFIQKAKVHSKLIQSVYWGAMAARKNSMLGQGKAPQDAVTRANNKMIAGLTVAATPVSSELAALLTAVQDAMDNDADTVWTGPSTPTTPPGSGVHETAAEVNLRKAKERWDNVRRTVRRSMGKLSATGPIKDIALAFIDVFVAGYYYGRYTMSQLKARFVRELNTLPSVNITDAEFEEIFKSKEFRAELDKAFTKEAYTLLLEQYDSKSNSAAGVLAKNIVSYISQTKFGGDTKKAEAYFRDKVKLTTSGDIKSGKDWTAEIVGGLAQASSVILGSNRNSASKVNAVAKMEDLAAAILGTSIGKSEMRRQIRDGEIDFGTVVSRVVMEYFGYDVKNKKFTGKDGYMSEKDMAGMYENAMENPEAFLKKAAFQGAVGKNTLINAIVEATGISDKAAAKLKSALDRTFEETILPGMERRYAQELQKMGLRDANFAGIRLEKAKTAVSDAMAKLKNATTEADKEAAAKELADASTALETLEEQIDRRFYDRIRAKIAKGNLPTARDLMEVFKIHGLDKEAIESAFGDMFNYARLSAEDIARLRELLGKRNNTRFETIASEVEDEINTILQKADKQSIWVELGNTAGAVQFHQALGSGTTIMNVLASQLFTMLVRIPLVGITRLPYLYIKEAMGLVPKGSTAVLRKGIAGSFSLPNAWEAITAGASVFTGASISSSFEDTYVRQGQDLSTKAGTRFANRVKAVINMITGKALAKQESRDKFVEGIKKYMADTRAAGALGGPKKVISDIFVEVAALAYGIAPAISRTLAFLDYVTRGITAPYLIANEELKEIDAKGASGIANRRTIVESLIDQELFLDNPGFDQLSAADQNKARRAMMTKLQYEVLTDEQRDNVRRKANSLAFLGPTTGLPGAFAQSIQYLYQSANNSMSVKAAQAAQREGGENTALEIFYGALIGGMGIATFFQTAFINPVMHGVNWGYKSLLWAPVAAVVGGTGIAAGGLIALAKGRPSIKNALLEAEKLLENNLIGKGVDYALFHEIWTGKGMSKEAQRAAARKGGKKYEANRIDWEEAMTRFAFGAMSYGTVGAIIASMFDFEDFEQEDEGCVKEKEARGETDFTDCKIIKRKLVLRKDSPFMVTSSREESSFTVEKQLFLGRQPSTFYYTWKDKDGVTQYEKMFGFRDIPGMNVLLNIVGDWAEAGLTGDSKNFPVWSETKYSKIDGKQVPSVDLNWMELIGLVAAEATMGNTEFLETTEDAIAPAYGLAEWATERLKAKAGNYVEDKSAPMFDQGRKIWNDFMISMLPSHRFFTWVNAKVAIGADELVEKPGKSTDRKLNKFLQRVDSHFLYNYIRGNMNDVGEAKYFGGVDYDITGNPIYYSSWDVASRYSGLSIGKIHDIAVHAMSGDASVFDDRTSGEVKLSDLPYEQQLIYKNPTLRWPHFYGQAQHTEQNGRMVDVYVEGWPEQLHLDQMRTHAEIGGAILRRTKDGSKIFENEDIITDPLKVAKLSGKTDAFAREQAKVYHYYNFFVEKLGQENVPDIMAFASKMAAKSVKDPEYFYDVDMRFAAMDYINQKMGKPSVHGLKGMPVKLSWTKFNEWMKKYNVKEVDGQYRVLTREKKLSED